MERSSNTQPVETASRTALKRGAQPNMLIKLQDYFFLFLRNWKWFFLSFAVCFTIAYYKVKKEVPMYSRSAAIMIKGDDRSFNESEALAELGIKQSPMSVTNEIMALTNSEVTMETVRRLKLDYNYYSKGRFHDDIVYGIALPVEVSINDIANRDNASLELKVDADGTVLVSKMTLNGQPLPGKLRARLDHPFRSPLGVMTVSKTASYTPGTEVELSVVRNNMQSAAGVVSGRLSAFLRDRNTTMIEIRYTDESPTRAEDILSTIINVYNENWIRDKNMAALSTNEFITSRLDILESELSEVEERIANYKSSNLMPDVAAVGAREVGRATAAEDVSESLDEQIYMTNYVRDYLVSGMHNNELLPTNSGINNSTINAQISEYNSVLLRRNNHLANSSEQNPLVQDLNEQLAVLKGSIMQSLDNELMVLNTQKRNVSQRYVRAIGRVAANPSQVNFLQSLERQQSVKASLYLYLLQKREENELSKAFTAYNSRLIEPPHGSYGPISPVPMRSYVMAFIFGLAIPASVLIFLEGFNTRIRGRKDLEELAVPFVGEVPLDSATAQVTKREAKKKEKARRKGVAHHEEIPELVVREKSRNVMNEAFRVVRSNLEFILGFDSQHHVIMLTSMNPGSGKTFVCANLATSLGLNGKKVIAVDLDMRKGSLSKYVGRPHQGISNYLSGQVDDYHSLIKQMGSIDVLPCGTLPPNPAELLYMPSFKRLISEIKEDYDYIFLDCPPLEIVADAAIINRYVDMTLFVVRAQLMDRSVLPDLEKWYEERRYRNLCVLLNGTTDAFTHYGYHKYGYRYGYHYGSYGYGYGNER